MIPTRCEFCDRYCNGECAMARHAEIKDELQGLPKGGGSNRLTGTLHRPHRFALGDIVRHKDTPNDTDERNLAEVYLLTVRIHDLGGAHFMVYPTYVLIGCADGEVVNDVLCTEDLVKVS